MLKTESQMAKLYDGKDKGNGILYQGCHPAVYGYDIAWSNAQVLVDCDNEWDDTIVLGGEKEYRIPLPEGSIRIHWKIEDGSKPDLNDLFTIGKTISLFIRKGKNVLVHCAAGQNRSALVAGAALFYLYGGTVSGEHIYRIIKEKQPLALTNYTFRNIVQTLEQHYLQYGV